MTDGDEASPDTHDRSGRPKNDSWDALHFEPQPMVRWLAPGGLAATGAQVLMSGALAGYVDKREVEAAFGGEVRDLSGERDLWVDFVADAGDGFDSTYSVAWLVSRPTLAVSFGEEAYLLSRGRILLLGGDEVYPTPSEERYTNKFVGPYEAALPWTAEPHPEIFAIPGNHDWYDGLTSFLRTFAPHGWIGGRRTVQHRSYFALQLPYNWWLWGIDIQFDHYIDEPQLEFFREICATRVRRDDRVILCTGKPSWVHDGLDGDEARKSEGAARNLEYFQRELIGRHGAHAMLVVSGDLHHYAHYVSDREDRHLVTAGGGGAFLHPTHNLPGELHWPREVAPGRSRRFERTAIFPSEAESKGFRKGAFVAPLQWRHRSFFALAVGIQLAFAWTVQFSLRRLHNGAGYALKNADYLGLARAVWTDPLAMAVVLVLIGGAAAFADTRGWWKKLSVGSGHALAHLTAALGIMLVLAHWIGWNGPPFVLSIVVFTAIAAGLASCVIMGLYLGSAQLLFDRHPTEAYSSQAITDFKNFLRLHLSETGELTVYPIGIRKAVTSWQVRPEGTPEDPWIAPADGPVECELIEKPFSIQPTPPPA